MFQVTVSRQSEVEAFQEESKRHTFLQSGHNNEEDEGVLLDGNFDMDAEDDFNGHVQSTWGNRVTGPGDVLADAGKWMRGHGTYVQDDKVLASVAGTLERVNKLVSVKPLRTKYRPEVGDLVIGRIVEVGSRRWKVEAYAAQNAVLMLGSVNLPGGIQRRKLESDELQMRTFFEEGDLLVAEVQAFFADGAMSLHTRSLKYGKLKNGLLVTVPPSLIVRLKSHFHSLSMGVDLIIGLNGYIWISKTVSHASVKNDGGQEVGFREESGEGMYSSENEDISPRIRGAITRIGLLISLLANYYIPVSADIIQEAYQISLEVTGESVNGLASLAKREVGEQILRILASGTTE